MKIWQNKKYYEKIAENEDFSHPGFLAMKNGAEILPRRQKA